MKKIMILGAGIYQVPLIKTAKEMGLYTIVCSIDGNYPGFKHADKVYHVNTTDKEAVLKIAIEENIDGIVTTGTDVAVVTIGYVCDQMNLTGLTYDSGKLVSDKSLMKKAFMKHGVSTARFFEVSSKEELAKALEVLTFPLIIKAVDLSGSRGIYVVENKEIASELFDKVMEATKKDYCIIEEFIEGEEFGAQAFVFDGELKFVLPHGDYVFMGDTGVPVGHFAPYNMSDDIIQQAIDVTEKAAKALKVNNAAMNCDYILRDGKVYVIEIGARAGATCLVELVSLYYGMNFYEQIIRAAMNDNPDFSRTTQNELVPNASMLMYSNESGIIEIQENHNEMKNDDIIDISFDYNIGDEIHAFQNGTHRIGQIIVKGKSLEACEKLLKECENNVKISVK